MSRDQGRHKNARMTSRVATTRKSGVVIAAIILVALNLRIALSSLPTVVVFIQEETGWNDALVGALTSVPVLGMGIFALVVPHLARRVGQSFAVSVALVTMTVAMLLRAMGALLVPLFISAVLAGISIAIIGGLVPSIVRAQLSHRLGFAASAWTTAMMVGAALGAVFTLPLTYLLGGWNRALAFWAVPAIVALVAWTLVERPSWKRESDSTPVFRLRDLPWRSPIAWALTAITTLNSIIFYSAIAWTVPSYAERGFSLDGAAALFGVFTGLPILGSLILPYWIMRSRYRRTILALCLGGTAVTLFLIAVAPSFHPFIVISVFGFTLGGGFAVPLGMLSEYAASPSAATRLTAMALSVTFIVAAFGPFMAGVVMDLVDSWSLVFLLLSAVALLQLLAVMPLRRGLAID